MKPLNLFLLLTLTAFFLSFNNDRIDRKDSVNPIIGDISFVNKFGFEPDLTTNDELRIATHLEYVENLLRQKNVSDLPVKLKKNRIRILDLLNKYWKAGIFPKNYDFASQRKPCFIDKDDRICAVGYLIEQTAGRQVAEKINLNHKYDELLAMNDRTVDHWISISGLTKEECAMIQPSYYTASNNYVTPKYGISSSILGGFSLALNTINGIQIANGNNNKTVPVLGGLTGATQIILGATMFHKGNRYANESQKTLSMVNIGLGTTTLILSLWNSISNEKPKPKLTTWNIYTFPESNKHTGMALCMTRKF